MNSDKFSSSVLNSTAGMSTQYVFTSKESPTAEQIVATMQDFKEESYFGRSYFFVYRTADAVPPVLEALMRDDRVTVGAPLDGFWQNEHGIYFAPSEIAEFQSAVDSSSLLTCASLKLTAKGRVAVPNAIQVVNLSRTDHLLITHVFRLLNRYLNYLEKRNVYRRAAYVMICGGVAILAGPRLVETIALYVLNKKFGIPLDETIQLSGYILFGTGFLWLVVLWITDFFLPKAPAITLSAKIIAERDEIVTYHKQWLGNCEVPFNKAVVPILDLRVSNRTATRLNLRELIVEADLLPETQTPFTLKYNFIQLAGHYEILFSGIGHEQQSVAVDVALEPGEMVHISASITQSNDGARNRRFRIYGHIDTDQGAKEFGSWITVLGTPDAMYRTGIREPVRAEIRTIDRRPTKNEHAGVAGNIDDEEMDHH